MPRHVVSESTKGRRLDQFLKSELPGHSRAFLQKLIEQQDVLVNGKPGKASYKVRAGDRISVEIPPPRPLEAKPEMIALEILFEDDDLIVLNKPAGLVVHPGAGNPDHTLVNALLHHCRGSLSGIGGVQRPGIVHRLDKGTTGCLVVAKTDLAHQSLVAQFKSRATRKIYRALCWGTFEKASDHIETVIGRSLRNRRKMSARVPRGRAALTDYRILNQLGEFALVELTIHTGRTHQIRVHMAHIGHPVVGDAVYGHARAGEEKISVARPLLHAYKLGFTHPRTQQFMEFTAPVPDDMVRLCEN
jgi:23S rRNA pseudouridine1911/1915/1917 synthase